MLHTLLFFVSSLSQFNGFCIIIFYDAVFFSFCVWVLGYFLVIFFLFSVATSTASTAN